MGEQEPFEKIRHRDENGKEYWKARELATALGYSDYRNFKAVMEKAKVASFLLMIIPVKVAEIMRSKSQGTRLSHMRHMLVFK